MHPLVLTFIFFTLLFIFSKIFLEKGAIDFNVVMGANCLFFLLSLMASGMQQRAMSNPNPNVFVRKVMAGVMIKMGVVIIAVIAYVLICGKLFNKPAVFISLLLYLVYLVVEVAAMMNMNKRKNA